MNDRFDPLAGRGAAGPPAELRARVLARAGEALARGATPRDRWTRLARSRVARIAWATAVVGLAAAHVALSVPRPPVEAPRFVAPRLPRGADPEIVRLARMPAIDASVAVDPGRRLPRPSKESGS